MNLDDKLKEMLENFTDEVTMYEPGVSFDWASIDRLIPQIKQAFTDEGYWQPTAKAYWGKHGDKVYFVNGKEPMQSSDLVSLMTGQAWEEKALKDGWRRPDEA